MLNVTFSAPLPSLTADVTLTDLLLAAVPGPTSLALRALPMGLAGVVAVGRRRGE